MPLSPLPSSVRSCPHLCPVTTQVLRTLHLTPSGFPSAQMSPRPTQHLQRKSHHNHKAQATLFTSLYLCVPCNPGHVDGTVTHQGSDEEMAPPSLRPCFLSMMSGLHHHVASSPSLYALLPVPCTLFSIHTQRAATPHAPSSAWRAFVSPAP